MGMQRSGGSWQAHRVSIGQGSRQGTKPGTARGLPGALCVWAWLRPCERQQPQAGQAPGPMPAAERSTTGGGKCRSTPLPATTLAGRHPWKGWRSSICNEAMQISWLPGQPEALQLPAPHTKAGSTSGRQAASLCLCAGQGETRLLPAVHRRGAQSRSFSQWAGVGKGRGVPPSPLLAGGNEQQVGAWPPCTMYSRLGKGSHQLPKAGAGARGTTGATPFAPIAASLLSPAAPGVGAPNCATCGGQEPLPVFRGVPHLFGVPGASFPTPTPSPSKCLSRAE